MPLLSLFFPFIMGPLFWFRTMDAMGLTARHWQ